jgi:hypothetical protein
MNRRKERHLKYTRNSSELATRWKSKEGSEGTLFRERERERERENARKAGAD